ncbi:MAG: hybrid sensor histidine kinase/response regulator [Planctomycetes bacterium]|nr:hybrid sensor histidine kinase/response regulator [Planctomycetota bacterium]
MRVLIADDSALTRTMLQDTLEGAGYDVLACEDGEQAWEVISNGGCHLAVIDWMMPGMSGLEVCQKIREQKSTNWVYAILLTGKNRPEDIVEAFQAGASDHVSKPFRDEELLARLAVGARIIALQMELAQAQKLESVGQLAAGIAHEINTPTQYVGDNTRFLKDAFGDIKTVLDSFEKLLQATKSGTVDEQLVVEIEATLKQTDVEYLTEEIPQAIDQSLSGVERVAKIVRAMKEFSHPGTEEKSLVNLSHAIETTVTVAHSEWKYVAEMVTEFDSELPQVSCLPAELNQVFLNLIVNAAHAIGDTLGDDKTEKGTITVGTRRDGEWVEIFIRDTGTGIPEDVRARIFDPFFTTKGVGKGTGQGLAIARSVVVDKHGGTIDCETELGKGTTFLVRLPIEEERQTQGAGEHENACTIC